MHEVNVVKDFIELYSLALSALAFIVYTVSVSRITAFNLVLFAAIILHIVHSHITRSLIPLFGVAEYYSVINYVWYLSFAITDLVMVLVCCQLITRYKLLKDRASSFMIIMFVWLAFLQVSRLAIREWGFDFGGDIYKNSVVFTNIAITLLPCVMAMRVALVRTGKVIIKRTVKG